MVPVATPRSLAHRVAAGTAWTSLESWGQQLIQLAVFVTLARLLGPEAYGVAGIALLVTAAGEMLISDAGWREALIQKRDLDPADLDSIFWFLLTMTGAFVAAAFAAADLLAAWSAEPEVGHIVPWLAWLLPLSALGVIPRALLQRALEFRLLAIRSIAGIAGAGLAGISLALAGAGVWSLVGYQLAQPLIEALVLWAAFPWRPGLRFSGKRLAQIVGFVWGVLGDRALALVDFLAPRILIGQALGPMALGYYMLARKVLMLTSQLLVAPLSRVAMPSFVELGPEPARLKEGLRSGIEFSALVAFPGFVGLAVVAPDLVPLLFGRGWAAAVPAVQLAALLGPVLPITRLCVVLMLALGRPRSVAGLSALGTLLFLALLLLPGRTSVEAVLVALLARGYAILPVQLWLVQRLSRIDVLGCIRPLAPLLFASLVMAGAVLAARHGPAADLTPAWRAGLSVVLGVTVYATAVAAAARPLLVRLAGLASSTLRPGSRPRPVPP